MNVNYIIIILILFIFIYPRISNLHFSL